MPKVSVVIPSYNHARYLSEAVDSVLGQSESDLELIVVDDGSTDESLEILYSIEDSRMRVVEQSNQGAHAALNTGLERSSGEFLAILNSDDIYHHQRLEKLVRLLEKDADVSLAGSYIQVIDAEGRPLGLKQGHKSLEPWPLEAPERSFRGGDDLRAALLTENYWATTSNCVFARKWYESVGGFRALRYAHDWDFFLRMAEKGRLALHPEALLQYRVHDRNTIREDLAAMIFEICWCLAVNMPGHLREAWFAQAPSELRTDQLLHSIYTFGFDRVLSVMLLDGLAQKRELAEELLKPNDPRRRRYLEYIQTHLPEAGSSGGIEPGDQTGRPEGQHVQRTSQLARAWRSVRRGFARSR